MNISENILKHSLGNVYILTGSPCGGKTTMCRALNEKYGFTFFNSNHRAPGFASWTEICQSDYQPVSSARTEDWDYFFNRPTQEYKRWKITRMYCDTCVSGRHRKRCGQDGSAFTGMSQVPWKNLLRSWKRTLACGMG